MTKTRQTSSIDFQSKIEALRSPETYPEEADGVELHETHMSAVFLTPSHVYKMKKPVRYPFLDFSTLEKRKADCEREVQQNRRLAPGIYEGMTPLVVTPAGHLRIGTNGNPVEWLVKMRRLPHENMLDVMLERGQVSDDMLRQVGLILARFYREQEPVAISGDQYLARIRQNLDNNWQELSDPSYELDEKRLQRVDQTQRKILQTEPELLADRARNGRILEGHGDLRPEHICLLARPVIFDCLEFNRDLRILDPIEELAYLSMEGDLLKAPQVGEIILSVYSRENHDSPPERLTLFYKTYRATLRVRLSVLHRKDLHHDHWPKWRRKADAYLRLAETYCQQLAG